MRSIHFGPQKLTKALLTGAFCFFAPLTFAEDLPTGSFAPLERHPVSLEQVELVSRVHSIGLWRGGDLTLKTWIKISDEAILGIDQEGRALNVIDLDDRTVAFVLSGERKVRELYLRAPGDLFAIDQQNRLLHFKGSLWAGHNLGEIVRQGLKNFLYSVCGLGAAAVTYGCLSQTSLYEVELFAPAGMAIVASAMIQAFRTAVRFEAMNELTDGFYDTGVLVPAFERREPVHALSGEIVDYAEGGWSLKKAIAQATITTQDADFGRHCEYDLLARGIPPGNYEPKWPVDP